MAAVLAYNIQIVSAGSSLEGEIMRQIVRAAAILAGIMAFSGIGFGQCKIVVVNMQDAVTESNEGKVQAAKFDAKVAEWTKKLDTIKSDLETAQKKLQTQASLASASVIAGLNKTIGDKQTELQRTSEDAQKDVDEYRDQLLGPVMMVAQEEMNKLAMEKNYSIVYDLSAPNSPIVYSSKDCDITSEVKTRMNAKPGGAAPASTAAPARGTNPAATAPATPSGGGRGGTTPAVTTPPRGGTAPATPPAPAK
jgi:outer membrane protein